ncbi:hypothetical protein CPC08DRAFT_705066 [Agrocybe pediades]|nr:hypothetical protein CPC08DRAFT_705066 [Agrocybe pediades]
MIEGSGNVQSFPRHSALGTFNSGLFSVLSVALLTCFKCRHVSADVLTPPSDLDEPA